ncbi:hypothetical protein NW062_01445 [Mycoplasmopsis cynos]|nr:hypothetical protein NW062_01445 [Mycoplasmopsis cynos]
MSDDFAIRESNELKQIKVETIKIINAITNTWPDINTVLGSIVLLKILTFLVFKITENILKIKIAKVVVLIPCSSWSRQHQLSSLA